MTFIKKHLKNTLNNIEITKLFGSGKWITTTNISAIYSNSNEFRYMVSAPMKNFKKAIHRNKVKRLLRNGIFNEESKKVNIAFIYKGKTILDSATIENEIKQIFLKIK